MRRSIRLLICPLRLLAPGPTLLIAIAAMLQIPPASAVSLDARGTAPELSGQHVTKVDLPIPDSPTAGNLDERLTARNLTRGSPVFLRIFKEESELEIWMKQDVRYVHLVTFPICDWAGGLGPKLIEGDKQSPEGFYTISRQKLHRSARWPNSFNLGFPNIFDRSLLRTGSYLLIHGGCSSTGCFAMTNPIMNQIHGLVSAAVDGGQEYVSVHVFPFRMSADNLARHMKNDWYDFWTNLKEGYDAFERTRLPPRISVCNGRYRVTDTLAAEASTHGPLTTCPGTAAILEAAGRLRNLLRDPSMMTDLSESDRKLLALLPVPIEKIAIQQAAAVRPSPAKAGKPRLTTATRPTLKCNLGLASCRRFLALSQRRSKALEAKASKEKRGIATAESRAK